MRFKMKKFYLILAISSLLLASLACNIPSFTEGTGSVTTNIQPQDTPIRAEEPSEEHSGGMEVYRDNGVEITLPDSYVLGDVERDLAILGESLSGMNQEGGESLQELYENNKDDILMWGYDASGQSTQPTSFVVLKNEEYSGIPLMIISRFANRIFSEEVASFEQERMRLGERDVLRILAVTDNNGVDTSQVIYLFNESGNLWVVVFSTGLDQVDARLSTFDAAVQSVSILEVD